MKGDCELRIISFVLLFAAALSLCACQKTETDLRGTVLCMVEASEGKRAGIIYTTDSSQGSPDHLSSELLSELLGDFDFTGVRGAVYLCGGVSLFEVSLFVCPDPDTAEALGGLYAVRFDQALKTSKKLELPEVDYTVKIYGNRVLAALCEGSDGVISTGLEKIKVGNLLFGAKKG